MSNLEHIRIVVVEPAGALNIGSIARVMKNMGLIHLILVNPQCDPLGKEARQMAVHGADILESATVVDHLAAALAGCNKAIATTAQPRTLDTPLETPKQVLPWLLKDNQAAALIFGRENSGLTNAELNLAQQFLCIPTAGAYTSLNLAQAVTVCTYELRALCSTHSIIPADHQTELASLAELEGYYQHLEQILLEIGYLYPHTAAARMEKFRSMYHRARLKPTEVSMLRGILSQIAWALSQHPAQEQSQGD